MSIDNDEKLASMCDSCQNEVTSERTKCIRCGKPLNNLSGDTESFVNSKFDIERFERLKNGIIDDSPSDDSNNEPDNDYDMDFMKQLYEE